MKLTLHHGSDHIVETPTFGLGKLRNDYGRGFYCTEHADMAREWAVSFDHDGYLNTYSLDSSGLTLVDINGPEYTTLHWLAVLLENRSFDIRAPLANEARSYLMNRFHVDLGSADLVKGYRADDSYFTFAQDFIGGSISYRQLCNAMRLGHLGEQIMVKSERAFSLLEFQGAEEVFRVTWLPRRRNRDRVARETYFNLERNRRQKSDLFITQILDEEIGPEDACLR